MIRFLHRNHLLSLLTPKTKLVSSAPIDQTPHLRFISTIPTIPEPTDSTYFATRDYLITSCGLSPDTALSAAQKINIKSTSKPNSVLTLFHNHGFSQTQISQIISKYPQVILSDPEKILKPKFSFLQYLGVSGPNLAEIISSYPSFLTSASKNNLIVGEYLKNLFGTNLSVQTVVKLFPLLVGYNLEKVMVPNIATLREVGVPDSNISRFLLSHPKTFVLNVKWFKENVDAVRAMGFDPLSMAYLRAVGVMAAMSKENWERKLDVYKEFGSSKEDTLAMFRKQPYCMANPEKKIRSVMGFFMSVLKWKPLDVFSDPDLLCLNMEKRIIPRCAVLGVLHSAGVLKEPPMKYALTISEKKFVEKYVNEHRESVPNVVRAYEGKIGFAGFEEVK